MNNRGHVSRTVCFGGFEIDREACELRHEGQRIPLQIQPFRVLEALIDRAGEVVTRADLRARIWPTTVFVDFDHGLNSAMTRLRHALGDSSDAPSFIETLPRIGYRFIHAIERDDVEPGSVALVEPHADSSRRTWAAVASALLIGVLGTAVWRPGPDDQTIEFAETPGSLQTHNPDAREAYLRGLDFFEQRNKEAIERSIVQLTRAMEAAVTMLRHPVVAKSLPPLRYRSSLR